MKLYFAGPLFTTPERTWNAEVTSALRAAGHEVFLPQEQEPGKYGPGIFATDVGGIDWADGLVAIMDGPDPDSGTAWEVAEPSVRAYEPQAVLVELDRGGVVAALCYNLPVPPPATARNPEYAAKLRAIAERSGCRLATLTASGRDLTPGLTRTRLPVRTR